MRMLARLGQQIGVVTKALQIGLVTNTNTIQILLGLCQEKLSHLSMIRGAYFENWAPRSRKIFDACDRGVVPPSSMSWSG